MKKILINLKDWLNYPQNLDYAIEIEGLDITVFPSLPYLYIYKNKGIRIGSQKISSFDEGPHTGSISARHLKDFDVSSVILNHRECQIDDVDKLVSKIKNAQKFDIETIICVGSNKKEELAKIKEVLKNTGTKGVFIAYEPTEELPLDEIKIYLDDIKAELSDYPLSYIYGSNITVENIKEYDSELDVDGYLISSHALDVDNLKNIIRQIEEKRDVTIHSLQCGKETKLSTKCD